MATIIPMRNLLSVLKKRFLVTSSVTLSPPSSPLPTSFSSPSFIAQFLVNSCGLPLKSSLSVSKKFQMDEKKLKNSKFVLEFLKVHNFSDTQITQHAFCNSILRCCPHETSLNSRLLKMAYPYQLLDKRPVARDGGFDGRVVFAYHASFKCSATNPAKNEDQYPKKVTTAKQRCNCCEGRRWQPPHEGMRNTVLVKGLGDGFRSTSIP
ncbi:hypothetical protein NC651_000441 [Populus alba x Populus x berolinensis]|nr:hypothetical protein NC651_000441 [Populus alba x Populus x berolinensis]